MKKIIATILLFFIATAIYANNELIKEAFVKKEFEVIVNGEKVDLNNDIVTIDGTSYLPLRELASVLNLEVDFNKGVITLSEKEIDNQDEIKRVRIETIKLDIKDNERIISDSEAVIGMIETNIAYRKENGLDTSLAESELEKRKYVIIELKKRNEELKKELEELENGGE